MLTTLNGSPLLLPEEVGPLLIEPVYDASVAVQVSTAVQTAAPSYRVPFVSADPVAQWVAEGDEISPSDATLNEIHVIPSKIAGLSVISSELAMDTSPMAAEAIGSGLARDIARRIDQAYFGALPAPAQSGLGALSGIQTYVNAAAYSNLDSLANAISKVQTVFANVDHFIAAPDVALQLATIKSLSGGAQPVLGMDATSATSRTILGVPMTVSPYVAAGTLWALDSSRVFVVVREDATVEADGSPFFTSDRVAVRAVMRVGFAFPQPNAIVKITTA